MLRIAERGVAEFYDPEGQIIKFESGYGPEVISSDGRSYADFILGYGPVVLGHNNHDFLRQVSASMQSGVHFPGLSSEHHAYIGELSPHLPLEFQQGVAAFFKSSSESVAAATRVACSNTERSKIVRCGFIGWLDHEIAGNVRWHLPPAHRGTPKSRKALRGVSGVEEVLNWDDLKLETLKQILSKNAGQIACMVVDTYQAYFCGVDVLSRAIDECHNSGVAVILDETKTAGRVSPCGLSTLGEEHLNADMIVMGKAIANGFPLSVLLARNSLSDSLVHARVGGTYAKEIPSIAAARATMRVMQETTGCDRIADNGIAVSELFNNVSDEFNLKIKPSLDPVFGGSILNLTFGSKHDWHSSNANALQQALARNGILLLAGHPSFVSLAHDNAFLLNLETRLRQTLNDYQQVAT